MAQRWIQTFGKKWRTVGLVDKWLIKWRTRKRSGKMRRGKMKKTWMKRARMRSGKRNNMYTNLSLDYSSSSPVQYWQNDSQHWPNSFLPLPPPLALPHPRHLLRPLLQFLPLPLLLPPLLPHCHHHPENNVFQIDITYSYFKLIFHIDISYWYYILILHIDISNWYFKLIFQIDISNWYYIFIFQIDIIYWYYILILHIHISYRYIILILFQYIIKMSFQKNYDLLKHFYRNEKQINHWSKVLTAKATIYRQINEPSRCVSIKIWTKR